jgi:putative tricarboxylic transport membrane protein
MFKNSYFTTGLFSLGLSLFLFFVGIPYGITSPSNVSKVVLSPVFWPTVLTAILAVVGVSLMVVARSVSEDVTVSRAGPTTNGCYSRLLILAILMVLYLLAIPILGLVWTSVIAFMSISFLIRSAHPVRSAIAAIVLPLLLYMFFAHVAGMSIPQGEFVRLP